MGEADDATLPDTKGRPAGPVTIRAAELGDRYQVGALLGRGGMGEVRDARDKRIERDVAVKLLRDSGADEAMVARFFREARVQGVLDHPAVLPVHDLGKDAHGNPYFVMKKLTGTTLADVLVSPDRASWPRLTLLARLVDVCFAIDYAHVKHVVHRDLKPGNIMLGDYNDTYVIDWGLAKIGTEADDLSPSLRTASGDETAAGDLLGTPGYMSPEQARGEPVDARTDIFALGCVLYEILAGTPALPRGLAALDATRDANRLRPSTHASDVPPELDDLCARATAGDRALRPTARELALGIQAYLDGDRDIARRKQLADKLAHNALATIGATEADRATATVEARAAAVAEAGRALALDEQNQIAQRVLSYLLVEQVGPIPPQALHAADQERATARKKVLEGSRYVFGGIILLELTLLAAPLHAMWPVVFLIGVTSVIWAVSFAMSKRPLSMRSRYYPLLMGLVSLALIAAAIVVGPLFIMPLFIIGGLSGFIAQPQIYPTWIIVILFWLPIIIEIVLEVAGILPSTFEFTGSGLTVHTWVIDLGPTQAMLLLAGAAILQTINSAIIAVSQRRAQEAAQNEIHAHKWHLQRLLPTSLDDTGKVPKL